MIFEEFIQIISRIRCTHTLHAACQKLFVELFSQTVIHEIKDPRKFCAIQYCLVNFQVHNFPIHLPLKMVVHRRKYVEKDTDDVKHTPSILSLNTKINMVSQS